MAYDLTDLRLFVLAVEATGIASAARQANISVSALSTRIKMLEDHAGVRLLERSARGSKPTSAGLELATLARAVLLQAEHLNGTISSWKGRPSGLIKIKANSNATVSFLPEALASFLARYPDIIVDLQEETSDEIARAVRAGDADVGIAAGNAQLHDLTLRPFRRDRLVLLVPSIHPLALRKTISFAETLGERFIGLDAHSAIQSYIGDHAARLEKPLHLRIRLRSFEGVCRMVKAGAGVAIVPKSVVPSNAESLGLRAVRLTDNWAVRELVICLPTGRRPTPIVQSLIREIAAPAGRDPALR